MTTFYTNLLVLLFWYVCGVINVAGVQLFSPSPNAAFGYSRTGTLLLCFGLGPLLTAIGLTVLLILKPVQYGTRFGRWLGRKIEGLIEQ